MTRPELAAAARKAVPGISEHALNLFLAAADDYAAALVQECATSPSSQKSNQREKQSAGPLKAVGSR